MKDKRSWGGERRQWEGEAGSRSEEKLSMICWNVCRWGKDACGMEQMRKIHDMRADVLDF